MDKPSLFVTAKYIKSKPTLNNALHKHWLAIESDPVLYHRCKVPPMLSYTKFKPLKARLRNNKFNHPRLVPPYPVPPSPFPMLKLKKCDGTNTCRNKACGVCPRLLTHTVVRSHSNVLYPIDTSLACFTKNVLYALTCKYCFKQYVGQTSYDMRHCWAGHKYAFGKVHKSLYYHFIKIHKTTLDVHITLLESVPKLRDRLRAENEWIEKLDTILPRGLNTRSNINTDSTQPDPRLPTSPPQP